MLASLLFRYLWKAKQVVLQRVPYFGLSISVHRRDTRHSFALTNWTYQIIHVHIQEEEEELKLKFKSNVSKSINFQLTAFSSTVWGA